MKVFDEMIAAQIGAWLNDEIADLESENIENNGKSPFFALAYRNLNYSDFKKLVAAAKRESIQLSKRANGCPVNPTQWQKHYALSYPIKISDRVLCLHGASDWMKKRKFWLEWYGDSIDGKTGIVVADYSTLLGDDSHYIVDMGLNMKVGINPRWLTVL